MKLLRVRNHVEPNLLFESCIFFFWQFGEIVLQLCAVKGLGHILVKAPDPWPPLKSGPIRTDGSPLLSPPPANSGKESPASPGGSTLKTSAINLYIDHFISRTLRGRKLSHPHFAQPCAIAVGYLSLCICLARAHWQ